MKDTSRLINLIGPINNESIQKTTEKVLDLHQKNSHLPISLVIHSGGGNLGGALSFYTLMRAAKIKIYTCSLSYVDSAATAIFLTGEKRFISSHTTMRLHEAAWAFDDKTKEPSREIEAGVKEIKVRHEHWAKVFEEQTNGKVSIGEFLQMIKATTVLTTSDLLQFGIAHEVLSY